jgi:hypothetical protein
MMSIKTPGMHQLQGSQSTRRQVSDAMHALLVQEPAVGCTENFRVERQM